MLPDNELSSIMLSSPIIGGRKNTISGILDYENGGIALNDTSEGLDYQIWTGTLLDGNITLTSPTTAAEVIYSGELITEFSFTFDQNMAPVIAFIQDDIAKLRWYDSTESDFVITVIGLGNKTPKVFLDDKRSFNVGSSDVILGYITDGILYMRIQSDRYEIEYELASTCYTLNKIGMGTNLRVQFILDPYTNSAYEGTCWDFSLENPFGVTIVDPYDDCGDPCE